MLTATVQPIRPPAAAVRHLRVALAGCGVVGGELLRLIESDRHRLARHRGVNLSVTRVLVRNRWGSRSVEIAPGLITDDLDEFLATEADVIVEAIGGLDPAARIARSALTRGIHFLTANKAVVAAHGGELADLSRGSGASFRFDAAVGGGAPILRVLTDALGGQIPRCVRGIFNGTSNFVLTRMESGMSLDDALEQARACGFAEADASRDLDGRDAADKTAIVAWTAFGIRPDAVIVRRRGLLPDAARLVTLATALDARLRLVAECELDADGRAVASVEPTLVGSESSLGRVVEEGNHAEIDIGHGSPLTVGGPGAGGGATATSLLSDLVSPFAPGHARSPLARPAEDTRRLRWIVATRSSPLELRSALESASVTIAGAGTSGIDAWVRTRECRWNEISTATAALDEPVIARDALAGNAPRVS